MAAIPNLDFKPAKPAYDLATIIGLAAAITVIGVALVMGGQYRIFFDLPSFAIVFGGTFAITLITTTWADFSSTISVLKSTFTTSNIEQRNYANQLISLAMVARQQGLVRLQSYDQVLRNDVFLHHATRLVMDDVKPEEIEHLLKQEIDSSLNRQDQAVRLLRRSADIAPAMGLIGTLVGLVQMLGHLEDPSAIGPAMALALLTTFYGAILGTVVLTPLSTKLEKRSDEDLMQKILTLSAALSMARQENPRLLQIQLNTLLAPKNRVKYFEE